MNEIHLDTKYFPNYPIDPNKEPDRFTSLSGKNNYLSVIGKRFSSKKKSRRKSRRRRSKKKSRFK